MSSILPIKGLRGNSLHRTSGKMLGIFAIALMMIVIPAPLATTRSHSASPTAEQIIPYTGSADFSLVANPTSLTMTPGSTQTAQITATSLNGFSGSIYMTAFSYPAAVSLNPTILTLSPGGSQSSTLTIAVPTSASPENYTADVEAVGGCTLFHDAFVSYTVKGPDFSVTPSKSQLTVSTTASDSTDLNLQSLDGFSGIVSIFTFSSDFTVTPSSATVTLTPGGTGSTGAITVVANSGTTPGNYTLSFDASSGSLFHFADVSVTVTGPTFGMSASPVVLTVVAGSSNSTTITVIPINLFSGSVTLTASPSSPAGLTGGLSPGTVTLPPAGTSQLNVTAPNGTPPGVYDITVSGASGSISASVDVIIRVKGPDFDLTSNPFFVAVVEGGASCQSTITASSIDSFSGSISLKQKNDGGLTITNTTTTLNLPATPSSTLTISAPNGSVPGFYSIDVNGTSGSLLHHAYIDVLVIGPDFELTANPSTLTVTAGGSTATSTISLDTIDAFSATATLTASVYGSGITATVSPPSISGTTTSTLTVGAATGTTPGDYYTVEVTGVSGKLVHTIYIPLTVVGPDFSLSASPSQVTFNAGTPTTSTITLNPIAGFADSVDLFVSSSANLNASIAPTQIASGSYSATLSLNSTIPGSYTVDVSGDNVTDGLYHDVSIQVTVNGPDFTLGASPTTLIIAAGSSDTATISVTALHGFSGTVGLTSSQDTGITTSFNPTSITSSQTSMLTITVDSSVATGGPYTVDVQGTSGSLTHDFFIMVTVSGFTLSASPAALTIDEGGNQSSVITVAEVSGFTGTVTLTTQAATGFTPNLTLGTITGSGTSTLTLKASTSISPGTYLVNVTGTSGGLSRKAIITVTVPAPDFAIAAPATTPCTVGAGCDTIITITAENGFSGVVTFTVTAPSTGITCTTPNSVTSSGSTQLSCTAITQGSYNVTVTGTSGSLSHTTNTITYQVVVAPDFTVSAGTVSPTAILAGSSGTSSITVSPVGGFTGPVTFSVSASTPSGLTCQPISTWNGSGTPTLSCSATATGDYTVTVTGSATIGSSTVTRPTNSIVFHMVDFEISASPTTVPVNTNVAGSSTITLTAQNSFDGTVDLATDNSACTLSASSVTGAGTSTLSCTFPTAGPVTVTITGSISALSHKTTVAFTVSQAPDYTLSASPGTVSFNKGASGSSTVSVSPILGFTGVVGLTDTISPNTGLTATLNTTSLSHGTSGYDAASLSFIATQQGSYTVTVTGTSGSLTHTATVHVTVTIPDFTITAIPTTVSFAAGNSATSTVTINPVNGFSSSVSLTSSVSPSTGLTVTFSTQTIASGSGTSTATFTGSAPGSYTVTITGTSTSISHTTTVQVTINVPDFTVSSSPTTVTIQAGNTGSSTITVAPTNGFTGTVALTATISPSGPTISLGNASITGGSGTSRLTITVGSIVAAGTYTVTIQGTSGSLSHSTTVTVTVTAVQSGASASTILGLAPTIFYIIVGILAAAILAGIGLALRARPKKL